MHTKYIYHTDLKRTYAPDVDYALPLLTSHALPVLAGPSISQQIYWQ